MRRNLSLLVAAVLLGAGAGYAQVQTGSILVKVTDEKGGAVPGVTVTITSPVLVAGQMTGTTDAGGAYRFPSLGPGTYSVKLAMAGFQSVVRENVAVNVGATTPLEMSLKVAARAEEVTVTAESPVVDTTSANVNVTLDSTLLQRTPGGRDIWSLVEYKVPGAASARPDVGGAAGGLQGALAVRGTTNSGPFTATRWPNVSSRSPETCCRSAKGPWYPALHRLEKRVCSTPSGARPRTAARPNSTS